MNGRRWAFKEEGCWAEAQAHWLALAGKKREREKRERGKELLMVLLHDWAFVTAIVLPATSARDTVV